MESGLMLRYGLCINLHVTISICQPDDGTIFGSTRHEGSNNEILF